MSGLFHDKAIVNQSEAHPMQYDMFATAPAAEAPSPPPVDLFADLPPVHIPPVLPRPAPGSAIDAWTRETQRHYLLYLLGAIPRYPSLAEHNKDHARLVLRNLNGLGEQW